MCLLLGIRTLLESSIKRADVVNQRFLENLEEVYVHKACQKKYIHPKLIAAALRRGDLTCQEQRTEEPRSFRFNFKQCCFLCGENITEEFLAAQKRKKISDRNSVHRVEKNDLETSFLKAAEKRGDEWADKIILRIRDQPDLVELGSLIIRLLLYTNRYENYVH